MRIALEVRKTIILSKESLNVLRRTLELILPKGSSIRVKENVTNLFFVLCPIPSCNLFVIRKMDIIYTCKHRKPKYGECKARLLQDKLSGVYRKDD